jgi:hypothetical protein
VSRCAIRECEFDSTTSVAAHLVGPQEVPGLPDLVDGARIRFRVPLCAAHAAQDSRAPEPPADGGRPASSRERGPRRVDPRDVLGA